MTKVLPLQFNDPSDGHSLVRSAVTMAFFIDQSVDECSTALGQVFESFLAFTPADALQWAVVSATSDQWKKVDAKVIQRLRDALARTGKRKGGFTAFEIGDSEGGAPQYSFVLSERDEDDGAAMTLLQMTFPGSVAEKANVEQLVDGVTKFTAVLQPVSGYCSPSLLVSSEREEEAFAKVKGVALRHPGYDVAANQLTQLELGQRVRGARWITILGPGPLQELGGLERVRALLAAPVTVTQEGGCAIIRAGEIPEIGDRNKQVDTPLLKAVARVLEPVTFFADDALLGNLADFDDDLLAQWERRFLD